MSRIPQSNLKSLSEQLGLSPSTVSRVLNGQGDKFRISPATQQRILKAARSSGVVINQLARGLRLRTTNTLGLVIPDISNPFFASLARKVESVARARGYSVLLADSQENTDVEGDSLKLMASRRVDGLVIAPVGEQSRHLADWLHSGSPVVVVDRVFPDLPAASVCADNAEGARQAVLHFAAQGHQTIACLQGLPRTFANRERIKGYRQGLKDAKLRYDASLIAGNDYASETGRHAVQQLFLQTRRPTALLALGNLLALGALQALRDLGLRVPDDVSLISFDEQPWAALLSPAMTTVSQPIELIGETAVELLFAQMEGRKTTRAKAEHRVVPVRLVERDSVAPPRAKK